MLFSSLVFLWYFLPAVFFLYFITGNAAVRNGVLLAASLLFYAWGEPVYVCLMLLSIGINYAFGLLSARIRRRAGGKSAGGHLLLGLCVLVNLGLLGYFKYFNFAAESLNVLLSRLAGGRFLLNPKEIALPIGISFYTFQALSYVVDVYRGTIEAQRNPFYLALYISFFPQLIAGPIVKYHDICEQIESRLISAEGMAYGIRRFSYGLAKKMLLANPFALVVDSILEKPLYGLGTGAVWLMAVLYTLQIYFDFSGYSDMAIGLGEMFGFHFMENFRYPYLSSSIRYFWRRWHISLSTWFKEYVYIPLGGSRNGGLKTCRNLMIVFFATGLWHGAGANFIIWGLYYGVFLILERGSWGTFLEKNRFRALNHVYVMLIVVIGWVFFRAENLPDALLLLRKMFCPQAGIYPIRLFVNRKVLFTAICGIFACGILQRLAPGLTKRLYDRKLTGAADVAVMLVLMFLCTMYLVNNTYNPFIYFRF